MVLGLISDVLGYSVHFRLGHRETAIASLPVKATKIGVESFQPFGGTGLDVLDRLAQGEILGEGEQGMDVIDGTPDLQRMRIDLIEDSGQVTVEPLGNVGVKDWRSVFGTENQMNVELGQGLGHDCLS